ncbi:sugar kinase [Salmonella enterica subsp. enterica]|nr:sugar kinase [Salmonella enterica subsp. enterica] [Salmonella enterica subsp. enterica serovar Menston]
MTIWSVSPLEPAIGGGIIVGRELYRGAHFHAGEFGVMPVGNNGESMHKIASTSGLMASCRQALALPAEEMPPADVIFERMATDVHLREAVNDWARYLSRGVYSVISMFDPGVVLIGGGISEQEKLYPLLTRHLETFEMWEALQVPIQPCQLGNQAGRLGAVWAGAAKARPKLTSYALSGLHRLRRPGKRPRHRAKALHQISTISS